MFARVSTYQGQAERIDEEIRDVQENTLPQLLQVPGCAGYYILVDRQSGRSISVTLWESESAMRESEEAANRLRSDTSERNNEAIVSVERFEVALASVPSEAATG